MNYDASGVTGVGAEGSRTRLARLGDIVQFAGTRSSHAGLPAAYFVNVLGAAHAVDQVKVFYNDFGQCMGYVAWALLDPEVERRVLRTGRMDLRDFEWNEGASLWITDFLVEGAALQNSLAYMRDHLFARHEVVTFARWRKGKLQFKRAVRSSTSWFWSAGRVVTTRGMD